MIRSCNIAIYYRLIIYSNLDVGSNVLYGNIFCIITVPEMMICFLLVLTRQNVTIFLTTESHIKIGQAGSRPEFHVNFGSGRIGSLHLWVRMGRVKKTGPTSNSVYTASVG